MQMSSDANKDFVDQLRMQELHGQRHTDGSDPYTYTDPEDGTVYDWDHEKKAWFPKITEDFLAAYQANYGFNQDGNPDTNCAAAAAKTETAAPEPSKRILPEPEKAAEIAQTEATGEQEDKPDTAQDVKQKGEKRKADPGWFDIDDHKNTNVYVSGLPLDIGTEEFVELMSKCGIVMRDPVTEEYKVKLYKDREGNLKGDGLCCYLKKESVELALRLIDETEVRGYKLHVEAARFELKGAYDASKRKRRTKNTRRNSNSSKSTHISGCNLDWRPEKLGEVRKRHEKVVIIRNMFHPSDFEEDPLVLNEYRDDLRSECEKFGEVKKVILFDRHPDGVASIAFKEPDQADACMQSFNGRWFGGRQLSALPWDGTTDFQVEETAREREERLKGWSSFLVDGEKAQTDGNAAKPPQEGATSANTNNTSAASTEPEPPTPQTDSQSRQEEEQEMDSTDSSLAGSDEEAEAVPPVN
uniref:HIV-1 Tat specific factor 1 n=1 Tax=Neogobius melanostomus TaxID=47308 RepID=A0A8C6SKK1_9GOBI